ncbi:hypothetical protein SAMD00019534_090950, partial [Acytostelium subglobosum LB1]|uniref:hypothetical protein n=1 Tax=Acytostelium subglobosum LB1 TaxID=1410327 RepID=UPI000644E077
MATLIPSDQSLEEQIIEIWSKKLERLPVYKDLPRLAGRISIESTQNKSVKYIPWEDEDLPNRKSLSLRLESLDQHDKLEEHLDKLAILDNDTPDERTWKKLKKTILKMTECFESKETLERTSEILSSYQQPTDYELHMSTIFDKCFDDKETSRAVKIMKLIHQNIIYVGCFELKIKVPFLMKCMTKDVRGSEGWRIEVLESKDIVTIVHSRREESLPTSPKDRQFWFEWKLTITVNHQLTEVTSTSLRIVQLHYKEGIDPKFKEEVDRCLCAGNLYIC